MFQLFLNAVKVRKHNLKFKFESMVGIVASMEEDEKKFFNKLFPLGDKLHKLAKTIIENRRSDLQSAHRPHTVLGHAVNSY